jgi:putative drug exporter of the RND superfamily
VLAGWVVALVLAVGAIGTLLEFTTESEVTNDPESEQAYDLLNRLPLAEPEDVVNELIVVHSDPFTVEDSRFADKVNEVAAAVVKPNAVVTRSFEEIESSRDLVSRDGHAVAIPVGMIGSDPDSDIEEVVRAVEAADDRRFDVEVTGEFTYDRDLNQLSQDDLRAGELEFGLPVALVVLLLVFGAVVAGLVPLILALISIIVALGLVAIVGQFYDLSVFTVNMLTGMGLALGIDYALFVVSRYREERAYGRDQLDAIEATGGSASRAVLFSGIAFVLAMFGLLLVPDTIFRSLATGAILVGIVSVIAALTLLPALLGLLGDRVNALRLPVLGRQAETGTAREGRLWSAVVRGVMRRPVVTLVASVAVLLVLTAPVLDLKLGFVGIRTMPDRFPSKRGFVALERSFGVGTTDSTEVVVYGDVSSPRARAAIRRLVARLRADPAFRLPDVEYFPSERIADIEALPTGDSRDERAYDAVRRVRDDYVPAAFDGVDARVLVTGETAESIDYFALVRHWLPIVFAFVLGLSFVLLTVAFRSIVVPVKAIVLNLLSVGAAYGLLVLVFEKGWGNELLGFQQVDAIEAWVPLFLFSVLFGLSMDYHVFLLSRIRERFVQTGDNTDAVAHGVASTARMITGAALIIIVVFSGFARGDLIMFQQMGFGVAVALLIDATLIRTVLLPASMKLLGDWNWYLPRWLEWLPDVHIEGSARS